MNKKMMLGVAGGIAAFGILGIALGGNFSKPLGVKATDYTFSISSLPLKAVVSTTSTSTAYYGAFTSSAFPATTTETDAVSLSVTFASDWSFTLSYTISSVQYHLETKTTDGTSLKAITATTADDNYNLSFHMASLTSKNSVTSVFISPVSSGATPAGLVLNGTTAFTTKTISTNNVGSGKTYQVASLYSAASFSTWILDDTNFSGLVCGEKAYRAKCLHQLVNVDASSITANAIARYTAWCAAAGIAE